MSVSASPPAPICRAATPPRFVTGSIARHILVMTGTGAVGLMAIFVSDFATIFFLGLLGDLQLLAAVGYAGAILFFMISARHRHGDRRDVAGGPGARRARRSRVRAACPRMRRCSRPARMTLIVAALWPALPLLLGWLGASGRSLALAPTILRIVLPSLPPLALGMCASAVLRSAGDPRRAMYVTLTGAVVAAILDAMLILLARFRHPRCRHRRVRLARRPCWRSAGGASSTCTGCSAGRSGASSNTTWRLIARFAIPAVLANVATPAGGAYVTVAMSQFSDSAVAGWAVIGRIIPIAFGAIFALSGAIGPIIGQNLGARQFERVRSALYGGLAFAASITALAWLILALAAPALVRLFNASGEAAELIVFFCRWLAPLFVFFGTLFVCNAACNTLGRPHYATALNWGRATLGTVPFVTLGAHWGAKGVLVGHMAGGIAFGVIAVLVVYRLIARLERDIGPTGRLPQEAVERG